MRILCVDSDADALSRLEHMARTAGPDSRTAAFASGAEALAWAGENPFDLVLTHTRLADMSGLDLAEQLLAISPDAAIVYCTEDSAPALEALRRHIVSGYLLYPLAFETLAREISYHARSRVPSVLLEVRCFGGFEVFDRRGQRLHFRRSRAKELLALLIERDGMSLSAKEICALFWEDDGEQDRKNLAKLWKLYSELNRALAEAGAKAVLKKNGYDYYADLSLIRRLDAGENRWDYLPEYDWAEPVRARLEAAGHR